jgi:hypothetical protein
MAELPERDSALLLDMLLAAEDARAFVKGLNEAAFSCKPAAPERNDSFTGDYRRGRG